MNGNTISILVQAGAVGISFALIYLIYWLIKTIVGNHIQHSTAAYLKMAKAIQKLSNVIESLEKRLK